MPVLRGLSLSVIEPLLVVGLLLAAGRLVIEPFVLPPVLLIPGWLLPPLVVELEFVVPDESELPPPFELTVEALRFIILPFELAFPVSAPQLAPNNAMVKSADNVNVFFIL